MRPFNGIKPQDIAVLIKLASLGEKKWQHMDLVAALGLSQTEISFSLNRCRTAGFLDSTKKKVMKTALLEFLVHGLKYVFPALPGPISRGLPTAHSAAPLAGKIVAIAKELKILPGDYSITFKHEPIYADDVKKRIPDVSKIRRVFGWEAKIKLDESLRMYIKEKFNRKEASL